MAVDGAVLGLEAVGVEVGSAEDIDPQTAVLRAEGVVKEYRSGRGNLRRAVDGIDIDIATGRFVAVVGPSGSGKSTLLQLLGGLDVPTSGSIWFEGRRLDQMDERARTEIRRNRVGFVFQQFNLVPVLTAEENVALPLVIAKVDEATRRQRVAEALDHVGLDAAVRGQRPAELSGGEQQRAAIARALVTRPAVILADEPTGALDSDSGREIVAQLVRACRELGRSVVMVTHDLTLAARADEIVRLRDGKVIERVEPSVAAAAERALFTESDG
jgi:putative ABC transport system ATP-binding protein